MGKTLSPKSQQRLRVMDAYRGRGHRNSNLWLGYSVKLDRDCIVTTDRQLAHWICFLELDPTVASFEFISEPASDQERDDMFDVDVDVTRADGGRELHRVIVDSASAPASQLENSREPGFPPLRIFTDEELEPKVRLAIRWMKALAYAEVIRNQKHSPVSVALLSVLRERLFGRVGEVITSLDDFDEAVVLGVLTRFAVAGHVNLALQPNGLCYATAWKWSDEVQNVVA